MRGLAGALRGIGVPGPPFLGLLLPRYRALFSRRDFLSRAVALARSTGVWWPTPPWQRRRSAIAGGQLTVLSRRMHDGRIESQS